MHRNIIIDLDETMVETMRAFEALFQFLVPKHFPGRDPHVFREALKSSSARVMREFEGRRFMTYGIGSFDFFFEPDLGNYLPDGAAEHAKRRILEGALRDLSLPFTDEKLESFMRDLSESWIGYFECIDGTYDVLSDLRSRGLRLFMLTDGFRSVQRARVDRCGLAPYFDRVYVSEELGIGKRSPEAFERLLRREEIRAAETMMIGDNYRHDYLSSEAVGITSLLFDRFDRCTDTDARRIRSLEEALRWLQRS